VPTTLLRQRDHEDSHRVAPVELFFDLVFVFAVTQLSHTLLEDLTTTGALRTLLLFLAVWWLWIFTSWVTNWLDPDRLPVRVMLFALMLGGLVLSSSIPQAFGDRGLVFGAVFAAMQVGRTLFVAFVMRRHHQSHYLSFLRIAAWLLLSGVFWVLGGLAEGPPAPVAGSPPSPWNTYRRRCTSGCRDWVVPPPPTGTSMAATWPSAAHCS
jgi:low temperature requirement protein LtrA